LRKNLKGVRGNYNKNILQNNCILQENSLCQGIGIIKVAYVSYGCLVFLKSVFSTLYDVKSKLIASSIHDAILQKQKNYDITYK